MKKIINLYSDVDSSVFFGYSRVYLRKMDGYIQIVSEYGDIISMFSSICLQYDFVSDIGMLSYTVKKCSI